VVQYVLMGFFFETTDTVYNNYEEIDYMFERLVAAVDATGLPQL